MEMKIKTLVINESNSFSILLSDNEDKKILPIVIGPLEAQAIALSMQNEKPPRPLTHDLLKSICDNMGGEIERIIITDLKDETFYAEIHLKLQDTTIAVDSRPSDAIVIALKSKAPIFMSNKLIEFTLNYEDIFYDGEYDEDSQELH